MLTQFYPPVIGGEERHVADLSVGLAARGHEVHVATLRTGGGGSGGFGHRPIVDDGHGVHVHYLDNLGRRAGGLYADASRPYAPPLPDPLVVRELAHLAAALDPDVVHAHNWIVNSYLPLKRKLGAPLLLTLHDYGHACATRRLMRGGRPCAGPAPDRCLGCTSRHYGTLRGPALWAALRAGAPVRERLVDCFIPVSRAVATHNGLRDSGVRWEVVPNFVPDALVATPGPHGAGGPGARPESGGTGEAPAELPGELGAGGFLFFAGDLSAEKGLATLLRAYDRLPVSDRPPLLAVGRPAGLELTPLPDGVQVHEGWSHDRVLAAFGRCLAAVLPSVWPDPCPTTVLEALALGAPLVTTHQGGIADMVVHGESALVVDPGNPEQLAGALATVIGDEALRHRLARGGRRQVRGFLQSGVTDRLLRLYESVTNLDESVTSLDEGMTARACDA